MPEYQSLKFQCCTNFSFIGTMNGSGGLISNSPLSSIETCVIFLLFQYFNLAGYSRGVLLSYPSISLLFIQCITVTSEMFFNLLLSEFNMILFLGLVFILWDYLLVVSREMACWMNFKDTSCMKRSLFFPHTHFYWP